MVATTTTADGRGGTRPCGCVPMVVRPAPCAHARQPGVAENLATASEYLHTVSIVRASPPRPTPEGGSTKKQPFRQLRCFDCGAATGLSACLQCFYVGCGTHVDAHFQSSGHVLALDCEHQQVRCRLCRDYVHDAELEAHSEKGRSAAVRRFRGQQHQQLRRHQQQSEGECGRPLVLCCANSSRGSPFLCGSPRRKGRGGGCIAQQYLRWGRAGRGAWKLHLVWSSLRIGGGGSDGPKQMGGASRSGGGGGGGIGIPSRVLLRCGGFSRHFAF
jgi:hypothetical protein